MPLPLTPHYHLPCSPSAEESPLPILRVSTVVTENSSSDRPLNNPPPFLHGSPVTRLFFFRLPGFSCVATFYRASLSPPGPPGRLYFYVIISTSPRTLPIPSIFMTGLSGRRKTCVASLFLLLAFEVLSDPVRSFFARGGPNPLLRSPPFSLVSLT